MSGNERQQKRQRLSYNSSDSTPHELNMLLVGPSDLCQPLASALLQVKFDRHRRRSTRKDDAAIAALRRQQLDPSSFNSNQRQRHVHMVEDWDVFLSKPNNKSNTCMNHVVVLTTPSNVEASIKRLQKTATVLDESYAILQRVSVVIMMEPIHGFRDAEPIAYRLRHKKKRKRNAQSSSLFSAPVACFPCQLQEQNSHFAVSRMILQRAKLGIRHGSASMPCVSPLVFATY